MLWCLRTALDRAGLLLEEVGDLESHNGAHQGRTLRDLFKDKAYGSRKTKPTAGTAQLLHLYAHIREDLASLGQLLIKYQGRRDRRPRFLQVPSWPDVSPKVALTRRVAKGIQKASKAVLNRRAAIYAYTGVPISPLLHLSSPAGTFGIFADSELVRGSCVWGAPRKWLCGDNIGRTERLLRLGQHPWGFS